MNNRPISPPLEVALKGKQNRELRRQNRKLSNQVRDLTIQINDIADLHDTLLDEFQTLLSHAKREKKKCEHWYDFFYYKQRPRVQVGNRGKCKSQQRKMDKGRHKTS